MPSSPTSPRTAAPALGASRPPVSRRPRVAQRPAVAFRSRPRSRTTLTTLKRRDMTTTQRIAQPVAVIGAGPVGLAAAAHLASRTIPFIVFEAGSSVGEHLSDYGHVRLFSPWQFNVDRAAVRLLEAEGWKAPDAAYLPT